MLKLLDRACAAYFNWRAKGPARQAAAENGIEWMRAELTPDSWRIDVAAPNLVFLLEEAAALLDKNHAENYIQFDMIPRAARTDWRAVRVTLQWLHGLSPAEKNARLEAELTELRRASGVLQACKDWLEMQDEGLVQHVTDPNNEAWEAQISLGITGTTRRLERAIREWRDGKAAANA